MTEPAKTPGQMIYVAVEAALGFPKGNDCWKYDLSPSERAAWDSAAAAILASRDQRIAELEAELKLLQPKCPHCAQTIPNAHYCGHCHRMVG